jgi:hypothetical protein
MARRIADKGQWPHVTGIEQCRCSTGLSGCRSVAAAACPPEEVDKRAANAASFGPEAGLFLCEAQANSALWQ